MLLSLQIQNIALMEKLNVDFSRGLHVLTGETGAGKSILVDAVALLLGGRAQKELIRTGAEKARVEGLFDIGDCPQAQAFLREQALDEGDEMTLCREITAQGRSSCRVNGTLLSLSLYQQLTGFLMDIHGQHEHQFLLEERRHLSFLDAYGDEKHQALLQDVKAAFAAWQETKKTLDAWQKKAVDAQERMELLSLRQKELKAARLVAGEEDSLAKERDKFRNAEKIENGLRDAFEWVYDGAAPAVEALRRAVSALAPLEHLDESYAALRARLDGLYYEAEDAGLTLRGLLSSLDSDPDRMEQVQQRLDLIRRLSRKYGGAGTGEMLEKLKEIEEELAGYESLDEQLDALSQKEKTLRRQYAQAAGALSASRRAWAQKFEKEMEKQLGDLNMAGTRFCVSLAACAPTAQGDETASFLIAPNRGEELQPLSKIASGGELSRLMLAIKSVAALKGGVPSMIFDEIDTGISGRTAQVVGEKMRAIAGARQVLCVTHLQQIAALADHHFLVEKYEQDGRTLTRLTVISGEERVNEIARMLGGDLESARKHAREMLRRAK